MRRFVLAIFLFSIFAMYPNQTNAITNLFNEGHVLILPKKHIYDVEELDEDTALSIMKASMLISKAIKRLFNPNGITICQNGGIFNELTHYHMHVVPRYKNQSFANFYSDEMYI